LGPHFNEEQFEQTLLKVNAVFTKYETEAALVKEVAEQLAEGKITGWFQGRMEFGPRSLGNRSILADPRRTEMQKKLNFSIKYRESFRPFAPAVMEEEANNYFQANIPSPYMLFVLPLQPEHLHPIPPAFRNLPVEEQLAFPRSILPAVTHVDGSARIQTVNKKHHPVFHSLLSAFKERTGIPVLVNTSFNVRGEPVVCTPTDAWNCFMQTEMDLLVLGKYILKKELQHQQPDKNPHAGKD
jgi:carbamoyltransferase